MFQDFDGPRHGKADPSRLAGLRNALAEQKLAGLIVPHADEHQSEYLPPSAERLAWLTGFSGSAGLAIVLEKEAALFVDGRYTLQAESELDKDCFQSLPSAEITPSEWLKDRLKSGERIGIDSRLVTLAEARRFTAACREAGAELVLLDEGPLDDLWRDRPAPPLGKVFLQPLERAGESTEDKLAHISRLIGERKADALVLAATDSIAWIFNIRGADIAHDPVVLAHAILRREGRPTLFLDGRKLSNQVRSELERLTDIAEPASLTSALHSLGSSGARVVLDPHSAPASLEAAIKSTGGTIVEASDPSLLLKARKNPVELAGMRRAHLRDGIAMVRFLAWLDREAPSGALDEIFCAEALEHFRAETASADGMALKDLSFDTISGAGANGAIIHYRVSRASNRKLERGSLYLVDSGGQYVDGTTDITRTVAIGEPSIEARQRFSLVLKGMIALSTARFPKGTNGAQLDTLARQFLWRAGLDYDHGTGHGVGSFLSVHEGPARIAKTGSVPLEPGMVLSNEPGFYKPGAYGIRIENLIAVTPSEAIEGGERPMLGFETLTLCPIDRRLIVPPLLGPVHSAWLDRYHQRVLATVGPRLDKADHAWLEAACSPIG